MHDLDSTIRDSLRLLIATTLFAAAAAAIGCRGEGENRRAAGSGSIAVAFDDAESAAYAAHGAELFDRVCAACHGQAGVGRKGLGKSLADSGFVQGLTDDALLAFIKKGRYPGDPQNTTGIGMPARGGNPALSEDDLLDIIAYLRTLQPAASITLITN